MVPKRNFGIAEALPEPGRLENRSSRSGAGWAGKFFRAMTLVLLVFALAGCDKPAPPLRVGANRWLGYEPLFLARDRGYYGGQPVQLLSFLSTTEVIRAYRNGALDVAAVTADEALLLAETLPDQRILLVCDFSLGADVILAKPQFPSLPDLKGRRIGVETTALGAYMLARALARAGMTAHDVTVVPMPLDEHEAAFRQDLVDAVVTHEYAYLNGYKMQLRGENLVRITDAHDVRPVKSFAGQKVHAVAGIGDPNRFFLHLARFGLKPVPHPFPDHHPFRAGDLDFGDDAPVVMTEKDAVKCRRLAKANYWVFPVSASLDPAFERWLLEKLSGSKAA